MQPGPSRKNIQALNKGGLLESADVPAAAALPGPCTRRADAEFHRMAARKIRGGDGWSGSAPKPAARLAPQGTKKPCEKSRCGTRRRKKTVAQGRSCAIFRGDS
jgi:hypothetical protein